VIDVRVQHDDDEDEPGHPQEGHGVLRDLLNPVDEIMAPTRRLGPGDHLTPLFLSALLLFDALLFQPFQALNALNGGGRLRPCGGCRRTRISGVSHVTKLVRGEHSERSFIRNPHPSRSSQRSVDGRLGRSPIALSGVLGSLR
jgi:hypothetical protein